MSSLCLLSVDDVYEQRWLAAECLMMHKIKPRLSAVLWLPSGSHAAVACWENKLQTAIRWMEIALCVCMCVCACVPIYPAFFLFCMWAHDRKNKRTKEETDRVWKSPIRTFKFVQSHYKKKYVVSAPLCLCVPLSINHPHNILSPHICLSLCLFSVSSSFFSP